MPIRVVGECSTRWYGRPSHVVDAFTIVRSRKENEHGGYRTKRVIPEIYEAMAEAERRGVPYQTVLDPQPADPRVTHPPRK